MAPGATEGFYPEENRGVTGDARESVEAINQQQRQSQGGGQVLLRPARSGEPETAQTRTDLTASEGIWLSLERFNASFITFPPPKPMQMGTELD